MNINLIIKQNKPFIPIDNNTKHTLIKIRNKKCTQRDRKWSIEQLTLFFFTDVAFAHCVVEHFLLQKMSQIA